MTDLILQMICRQPSPTLDAIQTSNKLSKFQSFQIQNFKINLNFQNNQQQFYFKNCKWFDIFKTCM